jgi:hypothetical protein
LISSDCIKPSCIVLWLVVFQNEIFQITSISCLL